MDNQLEKLKRIILRDDKDVEVFNAASKLIDEGNHERCVDMITNNHYHYHV